METSIIFNILGSLIPTISALLWAAIMALALKDSMTQKEKEIKYIIFCLFTGEALGWIAIVAYTYCPIAFVYMNTVAYFSYLMRHVLFYRFIIAITEKPKEKFSIMHYIIPLLICGTMVIWSYAVPIDIRLKLVEGHGSIVADYYYYSQMFLFKPYMNFIYSVVYLLLIIIRLWRYYTTYGKSHETIGRPAPWITLLLSCAVAYFIFAFSALFVARNLVFSSLATIISTIILLIVYMILGYNIIRRNFMLYIPIPARASIEEGKKTYTDKIPLEERSRTKRTYKRRTKMTHTADGKIIYKRLTQKKFENYFRKNKPWLNPQLKITDLLEPLETNRTILSKYINQTYGMNFKRYINRLRLEEVKRLRQLPNYAELSITEVAFQAGFANQRNYNRALIAEEALEKSITKQRKPEE